MFKANKNRVYDTLDYIERTGVVPVAVRTDAWRLASGFIDNCFPDWGFINPRLKELDRALSLGPARGIDGDENRKMRRAIFLLKAAILYSSGRDWDTATTAGLVPAATAESELRNVMQRARCAFLQARRDVSGVRSALEAMLEEPIAFLRYNKLAVRDCAPRVAGAGENPAVCYFTYDVRQDRYEISSQAPDDGIGWGFQAENAASLPGLHDGAAR